LSDVFLLDSFVQSQQAPERFLVIVCQVLDRLQISTIAVTWFRDAEVASGKFTPQYALSRGTMDGIHGLR
jgi:hypothetical protein